MPVHYQPLRSGERHAHRLDSGLQLIVARGRFITADTQADYSVWIALRGDLQLKTSDGTLHLRPRQTLVWLRDTVHAMSPTPGLWLCLHGPATDWKQSLHGLMPLSDRRDPLLYPHWDRQSHTLTRRMTRLARSLSDSYRSEADRISTLQHCMLALLDNQNRVDQLSIRCAGHSLARRRQNLLRLLRVRSRILMNPTSRFELNALAETANYSPWHFIRAFRGVFDETPCEYANRIRLEHARVLIAKTPMSITEIAETIGYDSRSAFCRSFRHLHGMSPRDVRTRMASSTHGAPPILART